MSRGALPEGLQHLTAEGLLVSIHKSGLFVTEVAPEWVRDLYVARQAIERLAAEQIHQRDPVAGGSELMGVIATMAAADGHPACDPDLTFHDRLVSLARSPRLTRMHKTLLTETRVHIHALEGFSAGDEARLTEHHRIAQSFIDRNSTLSDRLLVASQGGFAATHVRHGHHLRSSQPQVAGTAPFDISSPSVQRLSTARLSMYWMPRNLSMPVELEPVPRHSARVSRAANDGRELAVGWLCGLVLRRRGHVRVRVTGGGGADTGVKSGYAFAVFVVHLDALCARSMRTWGLPQGEEMRAPALDGW